MQKAYRLSVVYFLLLSLLLITSAVLLFEEKIGFSFDGVLHYYIGNESKFIIAKSNMGLLKLMLPHIFVFGLLGMVLLHFLVFTTHRYKKHTLILIYSTFIVGFLEIFSPFMILNGFSFFAYLKLLSFFLFLTLLLYTLWLLLTSVLNPN